MTPPNANQNITVWDWSIRVFHWSLPLLIFLLWFSQDQGEMARHFLFGQILLAMLVYRVIWGFISTPYARFKHFLYGPKAFLAYFKNFFSSNKSRYLNHLRREIKHNNVSELLDYLDKLEDNNKKYLIGSLLKQYRPKNQ